MESFRSFRMMLSLFPLLPLLSIFFTLPLPSQAYGLPDHYFINCGSDSQVADYQRNFSSGDDYLTGDSSVVEDPNFPPEGLLGIYKTARVFKGKSGYELKIDQDGPYTVRLHFYPFSSSPNLADAKFNVTSFGDSVLSNFGVGNSSNLPVIKEFLVSVKVGWKLKIEFVPSQESSFAFVNAIEAFPAPDSSIPREALAVENKMNINNLSSNILHVIYRINVGGPAIMPNNDTLWRNWVPDDDYLFSPKSETTEYPGSGRPNYPDGGATSYDAPDSVYNTARALNIDGRKATNHSNMTWRFSVNSNAPHFIRLHFSDIVSPSRNETQFNVYVYGEFIKMVSPYDNKYGGLNTPFYLDYVVNSDASGFMKVSVSPLLGTSIYAFLNGLEIMQLSKDKVSVPDEGEPKGKHLPIVIGSVVGGLAFVFLSGVAVCFCLKSRKATLVETSHFPFDFDQIFGGSSKSKNTKQSVISLGPDMNLGLTIPLTEILFATKNFEPKRMIGEGGFGKVYKGTMRDGVKVAVKRSEPGHGQGLLEFQTEIVILSKIRHRHLVSLIGYCVERYEMILVYEFMEKGTLRDHLYNMNDQSAEKSSHSKLSWVQRLEICIGAAKGLHYLHTGLNLPIIHRDIKSTNILLDEQNVAKVADFGLSRSGPPDQSYVSTDVKGSFGYLDPEYFRCMQLTQKSDVYSFGVVLLEVLCARPAINNLLPREQVNLADWGMSWQEKGQLAEIIDPLLVDKINPGSLKIFGETAEKCLQENGVDRPSMADVLWGLEYALQLQHTGMPIDPHEDTTTDVSLQLPTPVVRRLPSHIMPMTREEDSQTISSGLLEASEIFSQLKVEDAR